MFHYIQNTLVPVYYDCGEVWVSVISAESEPDHTGFWGATNGEFCVALMKKPGNIYQWFCTFE